MINPVSFKANYINSETIKRISKNEDYSDISVSFVQLDPSHSQDRRAIKSVDYEWNNEESFAHHIACEMENWFWSEPANNFYALTTQKREFDNLIPSRILGIVEVTQEKLDRLKIKFLQVDPETNMHSDYRKYKGVGSAILNALKSLFPQKDIILNSVETAIVFYENNGFKKLRKSGLTLIFKH